VSGYSVEYKVIRSVDAGRIFGAALEGWLRKAWMGVHKGVTTTNPHDSGQLRASLALGGGVSVLDRTSAVVGTNKEYGPVLEGGTRKGSVLHYGPGNPSFCGKETKGWFKAGVDQGLAKSKGWAEEAGEEIKQGWLGRLLGR